MQKGKRVRWEEEEKEEEEEEEKKENNTEEGEKKNFDFLFFCHICIISQALQALPTSLHPSNVPKLMV